jgi:predicted RNase H-like HicB family nuclease
LEDGTFFGRIPACKDVVAFAATLRECEDELRSVLEDWVLVGLKLGHYLPVLNSIDLNDKFIVLERVKKYENTHARYRSI